MSARRRLVLIVPVVACVVLLTCLGGPVLLWVLGGGTPNVKVDYVAKLNARAASVPEEDRAWPVYLEAIAALPSHERDGEVFLEIQGYDEDGGDPETLAALLERYAGGIERLRRAATMPELGLVVSQESLGDLNVALGRPAGQGIGGGAGASMTDHLGLTIEFLSQFRRLARTLAADARVAIVRGEGSRFVDDVDALLGMAEQVGSYPLLTNQLVGVAIRALGFGVVLDALSEHPGVLTEAELARLARMVDGLDEGGEFVFDDEAEGWSFYDMVQRMYTDDGKGGGHVAPPSPASSGGDRMLAGLAALVSPGRTEVVDKYERQREAANAWLAEPAWERGDPPEWDDPLGSSIAATAATAFGLGLPDASMFSMALTAGSTVRLNQSKDAVRTVIALERYRLAEGEWPGSLETLVPGYLDHVPVDRFDGKPVRYRLTGGGPLLYVVGTDREDDGGRHTPGAGVWTPPSKIAETLREDGARNGGDYVFFPVPEDD